jgi:glutamate carboxypeptidase
LIGHLDTVFEPNSPFQEFERISDELAIGPGIADMKGGNIIMLQALRALHEVGQLQQMDITVVITGDEELSGDPLSLSKKALTDAAEYADIAIGFENGDGNPATANISRRGSSGWVLNVKGTPAHSSQVFREDIGPGAI